jgi:hypothetical protein
VDQLTATSSVCVMAIHTTVGPADRTAAAIRLMLGTISGAVLISTNPTPGNMNVFCMSMTCI